MLQHWTCPRSTKTMALWNESFGTTSFGQTGNLTRLIRRWIPWRPWIGSMPALTHQLHRMSRQNNLQVILKPKKITGSPLKNGGIATSPAGQSGVTTSPMMSGTQQWISRKPGTRKLIRRADGGRMPASMTTSKQCVMHGSETWTSGADRTGLNPSGREIDRFWLCYLIALLMRNQCMCTSAVAVDNSDISYFKIKFDLCRKHSTLNFISNASYTLWASLPWSSFLYFIIISFSVTYARRRIEPRVKHL